VRGGGSVDAAPAPLTTLSPSAPDGTRVGGTVGVGGAVSDHLRVDGFAERLVVLTRTAAGSEAPAATYDGQAWVGGLTVGAAF
jgi:hypothetical protein